MAFSYPTVPDWLELEASSTDLLGEETSLV
jgi:hypothetical protein